MVLKTLQEIINFLEAWNWPLLLSIIGSGPFISGLGQIIKKNRKLQKWGVIQFMPGTLSTVHAGILLWLTDRAALLPMLGIYGAAVYGYTRAWYPAIKWADGWISKFYSALNTQNSQIQDKVLTTSSDREAAYAAPGATNTNTNNQTPPISPF